MAFSQEEYYDTIIRGAVVFDGESIRPKREDVGIRGERIAAVGDLKNAQAEKNVEAKGWILAPGFMDAHTHSDFNPIVYPNLSNKILQGVTTEVVGNCGMSAAPVLGAHGEKIKTIWAREGVEIRGNIPWKTFSEYRRNLEKKGMKTNFVGLVGHGNLRSAVMGFSPRPATTGEIEEMKTMLRDAMRQGARGISYGLIYLPGIFSNEEELVELCREAGRNAGVCAFHMRNEGAGLIESVEEAIRIGRKAQAPVQISHLKAGGRDNWPLIDKAFALIEKAQREGARVEADVYPYTATFAELGVVLPDSLYSREDRLEYFKNPRNREALLTELRTYYEQTKRKWETVMIAATPHKKYWKYEGRTIRDISRETGMEPEKFLIQILADTSFEVSAYTFSQSEEVVAQVAEKPYTMIGSDSVADGSRRPHPRAFGTFPKVLREYVREERRLPLGEMIRKMTSLPAQQFSIRDRGVIKKGNFADLVLFDAGEIKDYADYEKPNAPSTGIRWVFVNGKAVVKNGKPTRTKPGRFLDLS